eukprot:CAMPEP_0170298018 /NCGR_PEP_ID=MMETSP0116_2-20130129/49181_1 /TAXON_ID=400756 /ORGANISM="Durinskia baltica, Strain CSIRO CS-38" /LENGTH=152 /DNA_ID=CAMNT_0010549665 /DNA_START=1 /DNA_END=456 /DNA_ORIENTATION=+
MRGALMWEQRVEKEERAYLREYEEQDDRSRREGRHRRHHRRRRSHRSSQASESRLDSASSRGMSGSQSMPALMYQTSRMPSDLRAIQRFGIADKSLMTMRDKNSAEQGDIIPKLRMVPVLEDAHWVPGGKLLKHKPEFYFEEAAAQKPPEKP